MDFSYLNRFYLLLASDDESGLKSLKIPHSDVFFVRAALNSRFPELAPFSVETVERLLKEEGIRYGN